MQMSAAGEFGDLRSAAGGFSEDFAGEFLGFKKPKCFGNVLSDHPKGSELTILA